MILGIDASQANRKIRSGTEWYAFYLIQEFKQIIPGNVEVRLYLRDELQGDLAEGLPANFKSKILGWPFRYFWGQLRLSLEMLFNPPDILFCPAHTIPLIHPKKTFTTLHDVGFEDYPELYDKLSLWYHRWAANLATMSARHIFTVSEFSKERILENYALDRHNITATHLGVDKVMPIGIKLSSNEQFGLQSKHYLLYVGRLEPKKNILNIVKGYEMSEQEMPLVMAGRKIDIRDVETYLSIRPQLQSRIKFLNYISEEEKSALYQGAAVFLFPTLYEGFGLPILEAQAASTAVITSNTASNPEIAGEGAVLVNPGSAYEIGEAIKQILADENLRKEKIRLGLENVKRFNWKETARITWETLSK